MHAHALTYRHARINSHNYVIPSLIGSGIKQRVLHEMPEKVLDRRESEGTPAVQGHIAIKGTRNGLRLTLEPHTPFSELLQALATRLAESPAFFRGASLSVDTTHRSLHLSERLQLENLLAHYQMSIAPETQEPERQHTRGDTSPLPVPIAQDDIQAHVSQEIDPRTSEDTLYLRRTIRSGQAIQHHSHIIVLGDVNPGAEIIAGGDIIVWGVLRGLVHAGYPDNDQAMVCSLQLSPLQLRIAHLLSRPPEGFEAQPRPEVATIRNGQIIVETWVSGRPPRRS